MSPGCARTGCPQLLRPWYQGRWETDHWTVVKQLSHSGKASVESISGDCPPGFPLELFHHYECRYDSSGSSRGYHGQRESALLRCVLVHAGSHKGRNANDQFRKHPPATAEAPAATSVPRYREGEKCWVQVPGGCSACTGLAGCGKVGPRVAGTAWGVNPEAWLVGRGCPWSVREGRPNAWVWPQTLTCAVQTCGI